MPGKEVSHSFRLLKDSQGAACLIEEVITNDGFIPGEGQSGTLIQTHRVLKASEIPEAEERLKRK